MAEIICPVCDRIRTISNSGYLHSGGRRHTDMLKAVLVCGNCKKEIVFGMLGDAINFMPGNLFSQDVDPSVPKEATDAFDDAIRCFYGAGYRGVVTMCRSTVEESLDAKGATGRNLPTKIEDAQNRLKILGSEQVSYAQASGLIGRNALHRGASISQTQAMLALQATLDLINHIAAQTPSSDLA